MHVGLVCPYDIGKPGGVQQLTGELAIHLRDSGDDVTFVGAGTTWFHGGPGLDDVTVPAGRALSIRANQSKAPLTLSPTSWSRVRAALRSVDVIHLHEPFVPLVGWMALTMDKPLVATFHADPPGWVSRLYSITPGLESKIRGSVLTAVSPTAAADLPRAWGEVHIVPNAIEVSAYQLLTGRVDTRVVFLGRDEPRKGLSVLLEAWVQVTAEVPEAELMVMGAERTDVIPRVTFLGPVSGGEKRRMLASSRVYVAPNLGGESFGIVIAEAMAAGCAVIATDLPAFVDVAGGAAIHVPAGDPEALAGAIVEVLNDDDRAAELSQAARRRAPVFDWSEVVVRYRELYREALS